MKRRTMLARVGGIAALGFAGCVSEGDGGASGTDEEADTETTDTTTPMEPTLADTAIEVQNNDCGEQVSDAEVSFEDDAVVVTGTIWAPDPSWTTTLSDVGYDAGTDTLAVTVGLEQQDTSGPVAQCIAEIEYRATAQIENGLPGTVTVTHETNEGTETVGETTR